MADSAAVQNIALINALATLPKTLFGSNSTVETSGGTGTSTTTKQTLLSKDAVDALMKGLMEDERTGLARVASGARVPGMYNSTTQQLMINDLLARSAAEVAKASAPTTTTETRVETPKVQKTQQPGVLSGNAGLIGAGLLLGTEKGRKMIGLDGVMSDIAGPGTVLGGYSPAAVSAAGMSVGQNLASDVSFLGADWGAAAGAADTSGMFIAPALGEIETITGSVSELGAGTAAAAEGGFLSTPMWEGGMTGAEALPYLPAVGQLLSGDTEGAAITGGLTYAGTAIGGPIGGVIGSVLGSVLGGDDDCFITTAICLSSGKSDDCYELELLREFRDTWLKYNHPEDIIQYYKEAPIIVSKIAAMENAGRIWHDLNRDYIVPAVHAIEESAPELAYTIYKNLFLTAKEIANG